MARTVQLVTKGPHQARNESKKYLQACGVNVDSPDWLESADVQIQPANAFSRRILFHLERATSAHHMRKFILLFLGETHRIAEETCLFRMKIHSKAAKLKEAYAKRMKDRARKGSPDEFLDGVEDLRTWGYFEEGTGPSTSAQAEDSDMNEMDEEVDTKKTTSKKNKTKTVNLMDTNGVTKRGRRPLDEETLRRDRENFQRNMLRYKNKIKDLKQKKSDAKQEILMLRKLLLKPPKSEGEAKNALRKLERDVETLKMQLKEKKEELKEKDVELQKIKAELAKASGVELNLKPGGKFSKEVHNCILKLKAAKVPHMRIGEVMQAVAELCGRKFTEVPSARTVNRDLKLPGNELLRMESAQRCKEKETAVEAEMYDEEMELMDEQQLSPMQTLEHITTSYQPPTSSSSFY